MPELGEVAHATSILRRFLAGKVIKTVVSNEDNLLYVKPLTHETFRTAVEGLKVQDVKRHGKYFWIEFDQSPKVVLLHFGMTGWVHVKGIKTHFIVMENGGDKKARDRNAAIKDGSVDPLAEIEVVPDPDPAPWPPKFTKFTLEAEDGTAVAFSDPRRLGRVRLLEAQSEADLMGQEPLKRNGTDFSKPEGRWDLEKFKQQVVRRSTPIKTLLMDQALFAGVGNWVADEILFQARIHPEVVASTLGDEQLAQLYDKLIYVCEFSVRVEGNTAAFPEDWLMLHRWGKRKKGEKQTVLGGYVVEHVTVGGRTSSFVPELQKKTATAKKAAAVKKIAVKKEENAPTARSSTRTRGSSTKSRPPPKKVKTEE